MSEKRLSSSRTRQMSSSPVASARVWRSARNGLAMCAATRKSRRGLIQTPSRLGWTLLALATATTGFAAQTAGASPGSGLANPDFEVGAPRNAPPGWFVPQTLASAGIQATLSTNQPHRGAPCLVLRWPAGGQVAGIPFANVVQRVDATPWQGKRIRVTAAIRARGGRRVKP